MINKRHLLNRSSSTSAATSPVSPFSVTLPPSYTRRLSILAPVPSIQFSQSSPQEHTFPTSLSLNPIITPTFDKSAVELGKEVPGTGWVNMVANFNLTWKSSCLEILHYVRFISSAGDELYFLIFCCCCSTRNARRDRLLRSAMRRSSGGSGLGPRRRTMWAPVGSLEVGLGLRTKTR